MKKFLLTITTVGVICITLPFDTAYSASNQNCVLCTSLMTYVDEQCMSFGNCSDEEILRLMDDVANRLTAVLAAQARILIESYGIAMAQLYNMGQDPETVCTELGLCSSGGGTDPCPDCTNCSSTSWSALRTGYESRIRATCNCGICDKTTQYRCAAGYYGITTNGSSGCTRCPNSGSSVAGSTVITSCYLPSGTTGSDSSGTYTYTADCYYSN